MRKDSIYYMLILLLFVFYAFIFDYLYNYVEGGIPHPIMAFFFQIMINLSILLPLAIVTTRKIIENIKNS